MNVITLSAIRKSQRVTSRTLSDAALLAEAYFETKFLSLCVSY